MTDQFEYERQQMIEHQLKPRGIHNPRVLDAFSTVPRHFFSPSHSPSQAYGDHPLPIGEGQTISQPYMVALMSQCLDPFPGMKVLEIGTGSGYQTAILAAMGAEVFTIERIEKLSRRAQAILEKLGFGSKIHYLVGDGTLGWPEHAPYDRILVTAGAPRMPPDYPEQLVQNGLLVIPEGLRFFQTLKVYRKTPSGITVESKGGCVFVRLIGKHGWSKDGW